MNNRRKLILTLGAGVLARPFVSYSQRQGRVWRIGFLGVNFATRSSISLQSLLAGLHDLGYVEGKNIAIDVRWAEGNTELLSKLAADLVALNPDVIVTHATSGTRAAMQATATIPIVMAVSGDAIATGLVRSLAHPGGNITGTTFFGPELGAKRLELVREIYPRARRIAVLAYPDPAAAPALDKMQQAAKLLSVELQRFEMRRLDELDGVIASMVKAHVDAVVVVDAPVLIAVANEIASGIKQRRLPLVGFNEAAEGGGLAGYGVNFSDLFRHAAYFVDKIFKGAKPADIPVEQPTKFQLVINMKTAKALGVKIPSSILVRADRVIE